MATKKTTKVEKTAAQVETAPAVEKHVCETCGRTFGSKQARGVHMAAAHGTGKKAKPEKAGKTSTAEKAEKPKADADEPVTVTFTVPRSKLHRVIDAAAELGWVEVTVRF